LMAWEKDGIRMDMEDNKILYKFLADDWAQVLLVGKGKDKDEK